MPLTGVTVTKLDGTAKGGVVFNIAENTKLPIRFIGVGEKSMICAHFMPMILSKRYLKKTNNMIMTSYQLAKKFANHDAGGASRLFDCARLAYAKTHDLLLLLAKFKVKVAVMNSVALSHSIDADAKVLVETITQLKEYQAGQRQVFDMPIALYTGTPFQQKYGKHYDKFLTVKQSATHGLRYKWIIPKAFAQSRMTNGRNPLKSHHSLPSRDCQRWQIERLPTGGIEIKQTLLDIEQTSYQR